MAANGMDSVIITDINVTIIDTSISISGVTLTSNENVGSYQWINCGNNSDVFGETSQSFTPTSGGSYAVVVTNGVCSDTSACVSSNLNVENTGNYKNLVRVYPNPTDGSVYIELSEPFNRVTVRVLNNLGALIEERFYDTLEKESLFIDGDAGLYFMEIITEEETIRLRLIRN